MQITETFYSIQGEGPYTGFPTVFIRSTGCDLRCNYCDTSYSFKGGTAMTVSQIIDEIAQWNCRRVLVTGGEPLLQPDLIELLAALIDRKYAVSIESGGHKSVKDLPAEVVKVLDVKTPASGEGDTFLLDNVQYLNRSDELKFVVSSLEDADWALDFCAQHGLPKITSCCISPVWKGLAIDKLAEKVLQSGQDVKLNIQLHKTIWGSETRA
jgi:7-carboxy-7-deazaguanine synthase